MNRLGAVVRVAGGSRAFTYDAAGNVTLDNRTGGGYGYTYNSAGRLSEFRVNGVLQASYKYDALGRQAIRTLTSPTAVTIHSVFDSMGRRIAEYNEATGALIREYVWNGWEAIAVIEGGVISTSEPTISAGQYLPRIRQAQSSGQPATCPSVE